jgi:lipoyl(octanoyl) transferase
MDARFLGRIPFSEALQQEDEAFAAVLAKTSPGIILGFETDPVITLGRRASSGQDLLCDASELERLGFHVHHVDRGGQATIHNPGQLVIFPIWPVRAIGVRAWVESLAHITQLCLSEWNIESQWREKSPGLYTARGKIMACGVRVRRGISTHGLALNVNNQLTDFAMIRACGVHNAPVDRIARGANLASVFAQWTNKFRLAHC